MSTKALSAVIVLACLSVFVVNPQRLTQKQKPQPRYLYQVNTKAKQSGERRPGFIDSTGKLVIGFDRLPKNTIAVGDFHEGRARIYVGQNDGRKGSRGQDDASGFIDESGKVIIGPRYEVARDFSEGLAYVEAQDFKGFIDRFGKLVIRVDYRLTKDFHEGLAAVGTSGNGDRENWGYIDRSGKLVVKQQYAFADDFSQGLAGVEVDRKYGFINSRGQTVVQPRFDLRKDSPYHLQTVSSGRFSEGLACVSLAGKYGYINKKGKIVIPTMFSHAQDFSEGLAWVVVISRSNPNMKKVAWIDKTGQFVLERANGEKLWDAESLRDWKFSEGLVPFPALTNGRYRLGFMNRRGEVIIRPAYSKVERFVGGVAWVAFYDSTHPAETYGFIDRKGRLIARSD